MPNVTAIEQQAPGRQRLPGVALRILGGIAAIGALAHLVVMLWARHEFTQVESIVALHANMLASGEGLYYHLNQYPFTVSPYGPIFYGASALLHTLGVPLIHGARTLSFLALAVTLWSIWRVLGVLIADRHARVAGVVLAASTTNLLFWGTVGQVDMLACCFSITAFTEFLLWRVQRAPARLFMSGLLVILAVFTKQTALAAGAAIACCLVFEDRRRALWWIGSVGAVGVALALGLNAATEGGYFDNTIRANLNPLSAAKLIQQLQFLAATGLGLIVIAVAGFRHPVRARLPLYLYAALAGAVLLLTAPKIGSDLNYQIETGLLLAVCAACALDHLRFFPRVIANDRSWVTVLQIPLLLHIAINSALTVRNVSGRIADEHVRRTESEALRPFLQTDRGRVLSVQQGALVHTRGRMEVEPLIYTLLVEAGAADPSAVLHDLATRQFQSVILYEDVFAKSPEWKNSEIPSLPVDHLDQIRKNYRLVRHVPGPYLDGDYVYEPHPN